MQEEKANDSVRAVSRALDILLAFRPGDDELLVAEILKRVDLSRPTLYRLLGTLENKGFLVASGEPQRFRLGSAVAQLAHTWTAGHSLREVAQPMMRRLWEATRETVSLFVPDGSYRVCIAEMESPQPLSFRRGVGYRENLVLGASGRSILAHIATTPDDLAAYTAGRPLDTTKYLEDLAGIRARGYETSRDELIEGAVAVAAPFFGGAHRVAGSLSIFGPGVRMHAAAVKSCSQLLLEETHQLSLALGDQDGRPGEAR
ncbi:MAG: IclR family transcriptional regulator [Pseudomonadota bacterium]